MSSENIFDFPDWPIRLGKSYLQSIRQKSSRVSWRLVVTK
jgi:hypothetical protein